MRTMRADDAFIPITSEVMTLEEVADMLQISTRTLKRHPIPFTRLGRKRLYLRSKVLQYIEERAA